MMEPRNNQAVNEDENLLLNYLILLAKHSPLIILTSAAVAVFTYLILVILPNKYTATVRILPPQEKLTLSAQLLSTLGGSGTPGAPLAGPLSGGMASRLLGLMSPSNLYVAMMTGTTISDRIIETFHLGKVYKQKYIEDTRTALRKRCNIYVDRKDGVISVEVTDTDPQRAADIANAFPQELDKLLQRLTVQEASNQLAFLEKERSQVNQSLSLAENNLRAFGEKNNVLQLDAQTKEVLQYIARLRAEIDAHEVQIQVIRQQATPYNYDVVRLETEVQGLKSKLQNAESQYNQVCVGDVCLKSSKVPTLQLEYLRLYREVKFQEELYQFYLKMVELARLDMARNVPTVQLIDRALPPQKRSNKRLPLTLATGLATFFLMIFGIVLRESLGTIVKSENDVRRWNELLDYFQQLWNNVQRLFFWRKK
jgi:tyrosine-protein kinase Etk/Wzc